MTLTGLEAVLIGGMFAISGAAVGAFVSHISNKNRCSQCGIDDLRRDIRAQFFIIRHLAEKQGTTQEELLEIESKARKLKD